MRFRPKSTAASGGMASHMGGILVAKGEESHEESASFASHAHIQVFADDSTAVNVTTHMLVLRWKSVLGLKPGF